MANPMYNLHRKGDLFTVGNDEVGYKTFRMKVSKKGKEVNLDPPKMEQIATNLFSILKSSQVTYKSLANTKVTAAGIQTDQLDIGKITDIASTPEFEAQYSVITQTAAEALSKRSTKAKGTIGKTVKKKPKAPIEEIEMAIKESGSAQTKKWVVPAFFLKIYELLEKIFIPEKFTARHEGYARELISNTHSKIEALKDFRNPEVHKYGAIGSKFAYVPEGVMLTEEERETRLHNKKIGAEIAISSELQMYKTVPQLEAGGIKVTGYKIHSNKKGKETIREGRIMPTAFVHAEGKINKRNRLLNVYKASKDNVLVLRSGIVDTREKAKEFVIAAKDLAKQNGKLSQDRPLRIISHQLNSPETESKLVKNQHLSLGAIDYEQDDVDVAHINTPCNRFYFYTNSMEKLGINVLKGEKESRHQNIEGMARYLVWLVEDLQRMADDESLSLEQRASFQLAVESLENGGAKEVAKLRASIGAISKLSSELQKLGDDIKAKEAEKSKLTVKDGFSKYINDLKIADMELKNIKSLANGKSKEIEEIRKSMCNLAKDAADKGTLRGVYNKLQDIEHKILSGKDPILVDARKTIMIYRKLLGNQYMRDSIPRSELMERGQELMMFELLNNRLGVVSAVNCKSGLDRTGFVFAMMMSLMQCPEEMKLEVAYNWDKYSTELNQKIKEFNYDTQKLYQWLEEPANPEMKLIYRTILDFRLHTLNSLLNVCLPITAISTGLAGLKWGKGLYENLIPLNFIPPVVQVVHKGGKIELVQILRYNSEGEVEGLTDMGHRLLTQLSPKRGA